MKDGNGNPIGRAHSNPILDTRMFEVEFLDGTTQALAANVIAENMFAQVDQEGRRLMLLSEIIGHRSNKNAVSKQDALITNKNG